MLVICSSFLFIILQLKILSVAQTIQHQMEGSEMKRTEWDVAWHLSRGTREKNENLSEQFVSQLRFEPDSSQIQVRCIITRVNLPSIVLIIVSCVVGWRDSQTGFRLDDRIY
jgi:hypothetical protein